MKTPSSAASRRTAVLLAGTAVVAVCAALVQAWSLTALFVAVSLGG